MPVSKMPHRAVTLDPGDRHCGWVEWLDMRPVNIIEYDPAGTVKRLEQIADRLDLMIFERYSLYGWLAAQQVGSEFPTSQLIGVVKYLCDRAKVPCLGQTASQMKAIYKVKPWVDMKPREWPTYGKGNHCRDAFLHMAVYARGVLGWSYDDMRKRWSPVVS